MCTPFICIYGVLGLIQVFLKVFFATLIRTQEEVKTNPDNRGYTQYYVLAPTFENEPIAKLQRNFAEPELEWLKLVVEHLVDR